MGNEIYYCTTNPRLILFYALKTPELLHYVILLTKWLIHNARGDTISDNATLSLHELTH